MNLWFLGVSGDGGRDKSGVWDCHIHTDCLLSHLVVLDSLGPFVLYPCRLLCSWKFLVNYTGVNCHFLLQGIFLTQGSKPSLLSLLHCRQILCRYILYQLSHQGFSNIHATIFKIDTQQGDNC